MSGRTLARQASAALLGALVGFLVCGYASGYASAPDEGMPPTAGNLIDERYATLPAGNFVPRLVAWTLPLLLVSFLAARLGRAFWPGLAASALTIWTGTPYYLADHPTWFSVATVGLWVAFSLAASWLGARPFRAAAARAEPR
jgi:hypothetical protein